LEATKSVELDPSYGMDVNPLELSINTSTGEKISYMNNVYLGFWYLEADFRFR